MTKGEKKIMMKNKFVLIRYVLMLWMLCGASYTLSIASAYDRTSPSASWGYQPLPGVASASGMPVNGTPVFSGTYSATSAQSGSYDKPTYIFRSTSAYRNSSDIGGMRITKSGGGVMRTNPWGEPEGPGVGELEEPVGEPLILLFFALAFLGFRYYRRRNATLRKRSFPRK